MEVHHHPHVEKKNFKEYFLEFLMIFLAVTMGFFAESLRENINKHEKEEHLMVLMAEDLKADIQKLDTVTQRNVVKIYELDTLRQLVYKSIDNSLPDTVTRRMYYIFRMFGGSRIAFFPTERTLSQLDKTDGYSFIRKQQVSDSILSYQEGDEAIEHQDQIFDGTYQLKAFEAGEGIFNSELLESIMNRDNANAFLRSTQHFQLLRNDKQTLLRYSMNLLVSRTVLYGYMNSLKTQKTKAQRLIQLITKEYNLHE